MANTKGLTEDHTDHQVMYHSPLARAIGHRILENARHELEELSCDLRHDILQGILPIFTKMKNTAAESMPQQLFLKASWKDTITGSQDEDEESVDSSQHLDLEGGKEPVSLPLRSRRRAEPVQPNSQLPVSLPFRSRRRAEPVPPNPQLPVIDIGTSYDGYLTASVLNNYASSFRDFLVGRQGTFKSGRTDTTVQITVKDAQSIVSILFGEMIGGLPDRLQTLSNGSKQLEYTVNTLEAMESCSNPALRSLLSFMSGYHRAQACGNDSIKAIFSTYYAAKIWERWEETRGDKNVRATIKHEVNGDFRGGYAKALKIWINTTTRVPMNEIDIALMNGKFPALCIRAWGRGAVALFSPKISTFRNRLPYGYGLCEQLLADLKDRFPEANEAFKKFCEICDLSVVAPILDYRSLDESMLIHKVLPQNLRQHSIQDLLKSSIHNS